MHKFCNRSFRCYVFPTNNTGGEQSTACLVQSHLHTPSVALGHIENYPAVVDEILHIVQQPLISGSVARSESLYYDCPEPGCIHHRPDQVPSYSRKKFQDRHVRIKYFVYYQSFSRVRIPDYIIVVFNMKPHLGERRIIR